MPDSRVVEVVEFDHGTAQDAVAVTHRNRPRANVDPEVDADAIVARDGSRFERSEIAANSRSRYMRARPPLL